ncbi:MAG TPA: tripartite tricarboxylate transporter substrate binding protein [Burkholderiales bacterium]|nr:tripartite tricarboxylate transporter substrate binding protein [Burkholderiales bacterium]
MDITRFAGLVSTVAALAAAGAGAAQEFPSRPLRFVVPFPPGGITDTVARTLAQPVGRALGQSVIVENRPGANTVIGAEQVARAPADGHTVLFMAPSFTVNPFVQARLPYDSLKDFAGVTRLVHNPLILCVHPSLPVRNVKELVALAKKRPGELTWAVASAIGGGRIAGELFKEVANIDITVVPYGGGAPAMTAVLGGHTSMLVGNILDCLPHAASGRMRPIAVTSLNRSEALKDVPTLAESGYPGFDATNWFGALVRAGASRGALERLNAEFVRSLQLPEVAAVFARLGVTAAPMSPAEFDAFIRREMETNGRIIKRLNLKVLE